MSEWKTYKLGDIAEIKNGKSRPKTMGDIPVYGGNGILDYTSEFNTENYTIVIGRVGAYCGSVFYENRKLWISDNAMFAKSKMRSNAKFLYYLLKEKNLNKYAEGSSHPLLTQRLLNDLEITVPSLSTQTQIAQILTSLDDKIELNLQMNQTLEAMAQALFKEWFVNFNFPKSSVLGLEGLNDDKILDEEKKKNEILQSSNQKNPNSDNLPKGWKMGKVGEMVDVKGGTTPSTIKEEYWNGVFYWTTPKDLSNIKAPVLIDTERKITELGVKQISSGVMPKGTLLLSSRAPIGYIAISQVPISINQGYIAIQGKLVSNLFMLFWLKQNMDAVKSKANGSTFQEISKSNFREIETIIPSKEALIKFDEMVNPIFEKIVENVFQIQSLTQTRDTLLPKLMSGKITVAQ